MEVVGLFVMISRFLIYIWREKDNFSRVFQPLHCFTVGKVFSGYFHIECIIHKYATSNKQFYFIFGHGNIW